MAKNTATSRKKKSKLSLLTLLATIAITLPIGVYFISRQNTNLTDLRSQAGWESSYTTCFRPGSCATGFTCYCVDGPQCAKTQCLADNSREAKCETLGGMLCPGGRGKNSLVCCTGGRTCYPRGLPGCKP